MRYVVPVAGQDPVSLDVSIEELRSAVPDEPESVSVFRDPHRATTLTLITKINIRGLMDAHGLALLRGTELEEVIAVAINRQVRAFLEEGRRKIRGHP